MSDPWERLADEQIVNPVKSRMKAAQTRAERKRQKALQERDILFRQWTKWHREHKQELLTGRFSGPATALCEFLESMTIEDGAALIDLVSRGPWRSTDKDTKFTVLSLIDHAICYLRKREGLYPIDDPLPGEEDSVFLCIKAVLI